MTPSSPIHRRGLSLVIALIMLAALPAGANRQAPRGQTSASPDE